MENTDELICKNVTTQFVIFSNEPLRYDKKKQYLNEDKKYIIQTRVSR
jgi:hypothetical protein